jgi:hypothetical protein
MILASNYHHNYIEGKINREVYRAQNKKTMHNVKKWHRMTDNKTQEKQTRISQGQRAPL